VATVPAQQEAAAPSGQQLGNYTLVKKIGEGGMGTVYEAVQAGINRRVALKVLSPTLVKNPTFLERFRREARAAGSLNHPNMVTVYESGEVQGHHYLAMEFVEGETLRTRLKRVGKLPVDEALGIVRSVAEALDYAWNHGKIIHRDVKPDNIMLTQEGHVKLADLGLAKSTEEDTTVTTVGSGIGTPAYISPEQSQSAGEVDCRADIYSLGITLFQLVTGRLPFEADTPYAMVSAHMEQPLPDPQSLNAELSAGVCGLVRRMCEKGAANRYQSPAELIADIDVVKSGGTPSASGTRSIQEAPTMPVSGRRRQVQKKSPIPAILGIVVVLGVAGGVGYVVMGKKGDGTTKTTTTVPSTKVVADDKAEARGVSWYGVQVGTGTPIL